MLYTNVCNVPYQLYLFVIRRVFSYPFHCGAEQNSKAYLTLHQQPLSRTSPPGHYKQPLSRTSPPGHYKQPLSRTSPPGHYKANLPSLLPAQQINHQQSVTLTLIPLGSLKLKLVTPRVLPSSSQVLPQGPPRSLPRLFLELLLRSLPRVLPGPPRSLPRVLLSSSQVPPQALP